MKTVGVLLNRWQMKQEPGARERRKRGAAEFDTSPQRGGGGGGKQPTTGE